MPKLGTAILLGAGLMVSTAASAQSWGAYAGNSRGYYGYDRRGGNDWNNGARGVCSGQRARSLEAKLRHEYREGEINRWDAMRINRQIDRLERRQDRECSEGDWRAIQRISFQYNQIEQWIDQKAHGGWND